MPAAVGVLPGLQLQGTLLADDGKRVWEVLLHNLLHLVEGTEAGKTRTGVGDAGGYSTHSQVQTMPFVIKCRSARRKVRCVLTSMPAMSILSLTLNFCPISRSFGTQ